MKPFPPSATDCAPVQPGKTVYVLIQPIDFHKADVRVFSAFEEATKVLEEMGSPYYWTVEPLIVE